jgi:amino-acid N-acetyltransferase
MIRRARPGDWDSIERLLIDSALPIDGAREHIDGFLVAEEDGALAGCAAIEWYGSSALLRSVAVAPSHRGTGLGKELVEQLLDHARKQKIESLVLLTTTAAEWFPRFGFRRATEAPAAVKQSAEFRGACPDTAVLMSLHF